MSKDLSQEIENAEESIEKLKSKEFRVLGFKVTFISISALAAIAVYIQRVSSNILAIICSS